VNPTEKPTPEELSQLLKGHLDFGTPDSALGTHGTPGNINGQWVRQTVTALNTAVTCTHNMNVGTAGTNIPNVGWLIFYWEHNGTGASGADSPPGALFRTGDVVTANSIQLRFYLAGPTVNAGNPLTCWIRFFPMNA
jgi:hypothetical protein